MAFLNYIIQITISIGIVLLIHYLYNYFKETYTVKKTKDMYQFHQTKYNEIFETMKQGQEADEFKNELLQFAMEDNDSTTCHVFKEEQNIEYDLTEFTKSL